MGCFGGGFLDKTQRRSEEIRSFLCAFGPLFDITKKPRIAAWLIFFIKCDFIQLPLQIQLQFRCRFRNQLLLCMCRVLSLHQ